MKRAPQIVALTEYRTERLPAAALAEETGVLLWRHYDRERGVLSVAFPSPGTGQHWELTSRGWVGLIRVTPELMLALEPRIAIEDLFGMLEMADGLQSFHFLPGLVHCDSLASVYERLAAALAEGVLRRAHQGLYGGYMGQRERLPFVRGRLLVEPGEQQAATLGVLCDYEEHTVDVPDNQILVWTLWCIARSRICGERVQPLLRRALRALQGTVTLVPTAASACVGREYGRLNEDYAPLHALCRFFLEHSGPAHQRGDEAMAPFLVNMARLYEQYVAAWLRQQLPTPWTLRVQETVVLRSDADGDAESGVQFSIDLVLYDGDGVAHAVLDTKYRPLERARSADVAQVVAYAQSKGCRRAMLIYPQPLSLPLDVMAGDVHVQTMPFCLGERARRDGLGLVRVLTEE